MLGGIKCRQAGPGRSRMAGAVEEGLFEVGGGSAWLARRADLRCGPPGPLRHSHRKLTSASPPSRHMRLMSLAVGARAPPQACPSCRALPQRPPAVCRRSHRRLAAAASDESNSAAQAQGAPPPPPAAACITPEYMHACMHSIGNAAAHVMEPAVVQRMPASTLALLGLASFGQPLSPLSAGATPHWPNPAHTPACSAEAGGGQRFCDRQHGAGDCAGAVPGCDGAGRAGCVLPMRGGWRGAVIEAADGSCHDAALLARRLPDCASTLQLSPTPPHPAPPLRRGARQQRAGRGAA